MNAIITVLTLLFVSLVGYVGIRSFGLFSKNALLAFGCSYGLGVGMITLQMYLYSRIGIPWHNLYLFFPWIGLLAFFFFKNKINFSFRALKVHPLSFVESLLLLGIVFACGYTVFEALIRPVSVWDAWVTWLLKSKVFFIDGWIKPEILNYIRVNYPLVINLLGTFIYLMIGNIDDTAVLLTSSAFYIFTALLLFGVLKPRYGTGYALLFTFLLVSTQNFVRHGGRYEAGLADLPLGYYSFCSVILLLEYMKNSSGKVFLLLNIFLGITGLIKHEGIPMGAVIGGFAFYHLYKQRLYKHMYALIFWFGPIIEWDIFQKMHNPKDTYFSSHTLEVSGKKTINAFWGTFKELINVKSWNMLWIVYFFSFFLFFKKMNRELLVVHGVVLSQLILYLSMYLFTLGNNPESSIERLLMHIAPLAFYALAINVATLFNQSFGIIPLNEPKKFKR